MYRQMTFEASENDFHQGFLPITQDHELHRLKI